MSRRLRQITATTDVHSAFGSSAPMLAHLHAARAHSLVVDCGDFFEGSGYYRIGQGRIEREVLTGLYDLLAPGNHGWPHHFEPGLREMTVCANAADDTGKPLFDRVRVTLVGGRRVAVTAVISPRAFRSIPVGQRVGHRVTDPVQALREVLLEHHHRADAWVVLSHSGFAEDLKLAAACPFADVIFSGHCHADACGPVRVGDTLVVKGRELGVGYATAEPVGNGWAARSACFPSGSRLPDELSLLAEKIDHVGRTLAARLGPVHEPYRNAELDRHRLLREITDRLHTECCTDGVILNETALRPAPLGDQLTLSDLLAIEPFDNQLVHARLPGAYAADPHAFVTHLARQVGPLSIAPRPLPKEVRSVLTTDYLADTYLSGSGRTQTPGTARPGGTPRAGLGQAVRRALTTPPPDEPEEGVR
ncbi:bifunctional metallophosphatase/5'-nucleotidase [Streptomyces sp. B1866]|uniref:metallophosphoesterase n=1 Tax=Streptomyces sp. B1866 TaxID=3075431 RepID=UPI00288F63FA|nr:metallophosphoesterase [Streptomyces sp. B1866]MDT3395360.1 bifunctional metallophosphatase/5'-nucleotidase [Streptomyces sp. B1866]